MDLSHWFSRYIVSTAFSYHWDKEGGKHNFFHQGKQYQVKTFVVVESLSIQHHSQILVLMRGVKVEIHEKNVIAYTMASEHSSNITIHQTYLCPRTWFVTGRRSELLSYDCSSSMCTRMSSRNDTCTTCVTEPQIEAETPPERSRLLP